MLNYGIFENKGKKGGYNIFTTLSLRKKRNYLHLIDMAKNKTVLQTLGFAHGESKIALASQCVFTTLPFGEEAVESVGGVTDYLLKHIG